MIYPRFEDYDQYIEYHERCGRFALDMEQAHAEALQQEAEYEQWCWENGQYVLPDEYYYNKSTSDHTLLSSEFFT